MGGNRKKEEIELVDLSSELAASMSRCRQILGDYQTKLAESDGGSGPTDDIEASPSIPEVPGQS
jgi:hypothetical protein